MSIISFIILFVYLISVVLIYGVPRSISQTYYIIKERWIFRFVLVAFIAFTLPYMLDNYPNQFLAFLSAAGILFVAATPNFEDDKMIDNIHTYSAILSLITSQIWVGLIDARILLCWIPILIYGIIFYTKGNTDILNKSSIKFWSEVVMAITLGLVVLL